MSFIHLLIKTVCYKAGRAVSQAPRISDEINKNMASLLLKAPHDDALIRTWMLCTRAITSY